MRINCKQTRMKFLSSFNFLIVLLAFLMVLFSSSTSFAPTKMSDAELSDVEAQAIISINRYTGTPSVNFGTANYSTGSADVIRVMLGLDMEMTAHMRSFKMGYYDYPVDYGVGWDQDQTNYFWGTSDRTTPLRWTGVFIDFGFDSYTSNTSRILNYVEIGTMSASGQITASLNTMTGMVEGGTGQNAGVLIRQTASGTRIVNFNNEVMSFVFATKYNYSGPAGSTGNLSGIFVKIPNYHTSNDLSNP